MRSIIVMAALALAGCGQPSATPEQQAESGSTSPAAPGSGGNPILKKPLITLAKAGQLNTGMTYEEVKAILGSEGFLSAQEHGSQIYAWTNDMGGTLNVGFKDGKMTDKSDFGLK